MLTCGKILGGLLVVLGGVFMPGSVLFAFVGAAMCLEAVYSLCGDDE